MRVLSVVGARPQFVKAALVSGELARRGIEEILVHTGQHYDPGLSDVFFEQLHLPDPRYQLGVGSGGHGAQTGEMMRRLEPIVQNERPDCVIIYGDTNSTLAGGLVGAKLQIPVAHVEAGLRSFNRSMPEEINRIVVDHVSTILLAPNEQSARQLSDEGISRGVHIVGDLMADHAQAIAAALPPNPAVLERFGLQRRAYAVTTVHRPSNTDDEAAFARILEGLRAIEIPVVFPVHPRTQALARKHRVGDADNLLACEPLPYAEMVALVANAAMVFTDSGGLQKETFILRVPCTTLREETEWLDTLVNGWNVLAGSDARKIVEAWQRPAPGVQAPTIDDGFTTRRIVDALIEHRAMRAA